MTQAQASVNQRPLPAAARVFEKDPESALAAAAPLGSASLRPAWSFPAGDDQRRWPPNSASEWR